MSQLVPERDDAVSKRDIPVIDSQVLLERDALEGGILVRTEELLAFGTQLDADLDTLVRRWQPLAAPRALLADRRRSSWQ